MNDALRLDHIVREQGALRTNNRAVDGLREVQQALLNPRQVSMIARA